MNTSKAQMRSAGIKVAIFSIVSIFVTSVLVTIMGKFGAGDTKEYFAIFESASMVKKGDDVRVAGVVLGKVKEVEVFERDKARVKFTVAQDLPLTSASKVEIRYLNLVGARYMTVLQGSSGGAALPEGATIPLAQTQPALNLTELYDGFQPLFQALDPKDVNELAGNLIRVMQGEGGTLESLLSNTASLTNTLADRDELIGQVIENLNETLGTVDGRRAQLSRLIRGLSTWVDGLADDRVLIGESVASVAGLTQQLADLLTRGRPLLKEDIAQLRRLATVLNTQESRRVLNQILTNLPEMLEDQTRTGTYGSWYNYYLCKVQLNLTLPGGITGVPGLAALTSQLMNLEYYSTAERCSL